MIRWLALTVLVLLPAQQDKLIDLWRMERDLVLGKCAERHYDIAKWAWENELLSQSTTQVLEALEISDQRHKRAKVALSKMQNLDDERWTEVRPPSVTVVKAYHKKVRKARERDLRDHLELAKWAYKKKLPVEARAVYERLLQRSGRALEVDSKGRIKLERGTVPEDLSALILADAVRIDDQPYLRDEALEQLREFEAVAQKSSERLRVLGAIDGERVAGLFALGEAFYLRLKKEFGDHPAERLEVFVFPTRATYEAHLDRIDLAGYKPADGMADRASNRAYLCAEAPDLEALFLHEMTHLFHYGITRGVLPDWYEEGLAETFGGQGSFTWDGKDLVVGGVLAPHVLGRLANEEYWLSLDELLAVEAVQLFAQDIERAWSFYAQAWALVRFLRGTEEYSERFERWERMTRGAALGAEADDRRGGDPAAARALFVNLFAGDLEQMEQSYRESLRGY